jgi:tetratricopeptide (TPR) repeat protein
MAKYPGGEDTGALFAVLIDSLERQQRDEELLDWLSRKDRPRSVELESRAAWLYWKLGQLDAVISSLEWIRDSEQQLEVKEMALLGEAYYQRERNQAAEKVYNSLHEDQVYASQARYRSAQLLIKRGERSAALKLLEQAVEKDPAGAWGKLARDLLLQEQR